MDITLTWALPINQLPTDEYDVLYKVWDSAGTNNWVLANTTPLPSTTTTYTITGLDPNTIYRVAVTKSCVGGGSYVDEATYVNIVCPLVSFWQGPVVNSEQTLFYSVNYPDATHVTNTEILVYDTTFDDRFLADCGAGPTAIPIGRTSYQIADGCTTPNVVSCVKQKLDYIVPNTGVSGVGYYGLDTMAGFNPLLCDGATGDPLLFRAGNTYKFEIITVIDAVSLGVTINFSTFDTTCNVVASAPVYTMLSNPVPDGALLSSALCFDPLTGLVSFTTADGTGTTNINDYSFSYSTSDGSITLPLLDNAGNIVSSYNGSYNIYAPIKIQTYAPGGGNSAGYTITNAVVSGGNTTYTYTGGTNAFTVGQEVFVNSVNPIAFNFPTGSKVITAATNNSFTVSFGPAGTYQTGGIASGYIELTSGMTVTVDLQPAQNVITLTNQNYAGLTLIQALTQVATAINNAGIYTASAVVIAGLPYLKIDVPDTTYTSASVVIEGPNILTKGTPDIPQTATVGNIGSTTSSISYNGFLYAAFNESTAKIVASDITNTIPPANYTHDINIPVREICLVPEVPPSVVYPVTYVGSGGDHSLNIAVAGTPSAWNEGYTYIAENTTISAYDGFNLIDSQDISALFGGSNNPIRLMEYNNTNNYLYVFIDGSVNNFHIILHTGVSSWSIGHTGTYGQTNYLERSTITAWNNITSGSSTAATGIVTGVPIVPIPLGTIPNPPNIYQPNSARFQDSLKTWNTVPPSSVSFSSDTYKVYNITQQILGEMFYYSSSGTDIYPGISGTTISIRRGIDSTRPIPNTVPFTVSTGDDYGIFHAYNIVDYNASFLSRVWSNTTRYLIEAGRNAGSNGFLNVSGRTNTVFPIDSYTRYFNSPVPDKMISGTTGLDDSSDYLLYEINDGGTCYNSTSNLIYISLGNGTYQTIPAAGTPVVTHQIYTDYPTNTVPLNAPLQLVSDPNSANVYGILRDARLDSSLDDKNIYILGPGGQTGIVDGSAKWNNAICGQISFDSDKLYFTGKNTRNMYEYDLSIDTWTSNVIPSVYEKLNGFTYGDDTVIERVQGATSIGVSGKFVVMNYLQQTYSTELKYTYDVANIFVYDFATNTVDQVLTGSGVNVYSGVYTAYNPNRYGEFFGFNDYNTDYCYGGLSIKVDLSGRIYWKKSISDQIYVSTPYSESGVAQIWGTPIGGNVLRIWNIQSNGSLVQSKRTIYDYYSSSFSNLIYDSYYEKVIMVPSGNGYQFYLINTKTLGGLHGVNTIGTNIKNQGTFANGLTPSVANQGKNCTVYAVAVSATDITYSVRPSIISSIYNGIFPHHFAVGDIVNITGITSSPANELNFPNPGASSAVITGVTQTTFTIANVEGTSATYTSGGGVQLSKYANMDTALTVQSDNAGNIYSYSLVAYSGSGPYYLPYSTLILKYGPLDILTQRETPDYIDLGVVSSTCSATPDGLFYNSSFATCVKDFGFIKVANQNTYWLIGNKNPTCTITNITNAVYNAGTQTIRYYINNSFSVGKVVNISGVLPSTYNVSRVTITAADPAWFEISYTGAAPAAFDPLTPATSNVILSPSYVIKVLDDTTFATIATIDLSFINGYLDNFLNYFSSIQYSPSTNEIYFYYHSSASPVYVFSTVTNSLVKSSSFNRMVISYANLDYVYTIEDVNGIPYFSAATLDIPIRRWFRLDLGSRVYLDNVHNELNVIANDGVTTTTDNYDLYSFSTLSDTFGQWKVTTSTTWASIPGGSNITVNANEIIEFTMFSTTNTLVSVENVTTSTVYDIPSYNNLATFPTYNTLNSVLAFVIQADSVNLSNGDVLEFTFENPDNPNCQFINSVTINF